MKLTVPPEFANAKAMISLSNVVAARARPGELRHGLRTVNHGFPPQFVLLAACCRWPPSESGNAAIRCAAAATIDWEDFLSLAHRQRVSGLVHEALSAAAIDYPAAIAEKLGRRARRITRKNLISAGETLRLCRALEAAGILVLVLKGAALAQLAYGSLKARHFRDVDLLVDPDRAEAAWRLLEGEGYALVAPARRLRKTQRRALIRYGREAEFACTEKNTRVELQWRVAANPLLLKGVGAHSPAQTVALSDGAAVRTLARDDLFAYLCVHGAQHAWGRLKWLADVNALIAGDGDGIERLYRHAQTRGAGLCAAQAIALCRLIFGLTLPPALAQEIAADRRIGQLSEIALGTMTAPSAPLETDPGVFGVARTVRMQFLLGRGWPFLVAQARAAMVGPADVLALPLPRPLHFLYPLLRLPLWLWRRARLLGAKRPPKTRAYG